MKLVILAGGLGTRLSEHTGVIPKPMVEIGGEPILCHIMRYYSSFGINEFVIALGYKGEIIKQYFLNYFHQRCDLELDLATGEVNIRDDSKALPWRVHLVDTGLETMTGGRLKKLRHLVGEKTFMLTYGDGVSNVDLTALGEFHLKKGNLVSVTAVNPKSHYGELDIDNEGQVKTFMEKPEFQNSWINGGFMVIDPDVIDYIDGDKTMLEREPFEKVSKMGRMGAFKHDGFWQCMDTVRDRKLLCDLWDSGCAEWRVW